MAQDNREPTVDQGIIALAWVVGLIGVIAAGMLFAAIIWANFVGPK